MSALIVKDLKKIYSNGTAALNGINLEVAEGDFFALLGQNGAGKSTTIGIISSLINKTSGQVKIFDYDIDREITKAKLMIGVVPQEMNFSIFDKVSQILVNQAGYYGIKKSIALDRMEKYLNAMGIWHMHNQAAFKLSGGMKRRLMIARALMNEPKLLILDEPTAGVDIELRRTLWDFLRTLNQQGTTIILTTHYLEEAEYLCKHVAIIDRGEIIENSTMKSLIGQLNTQTLIFELENPIEHLPDFQDFPHRIIDSKTIEVDVTQGHSINDLFTSLNAKKILVTNMRNKTNRLEELYMRIINNNRPQDTL